MLGNASTRKVTIRAKITRASGRVDELNPCNPFAVLWVNFKHRVFTLLRR